MVCLERRLTVPVGRTQPGGPKPLTQQELETQRSGFLRAMSDAGLKPTVVYHNLSPAELYEKVCTRSCVVVSVDR